MVQLILKLALLLGVLIWFHTTLFCQKQDKFLFMPDSLGIEFVDNDSIHFFNSYQRDYTCGAAISSPSGILEYYSMSEPYNLNDRLFDKYGAYLQNGKDKVVRGSKGIFQGIQGIRKASFIPFYNKSKEYYYLTVPLVEDSSLGQGNFPYYGFQLYIHKIDVENDSLIYKNKLLYPKNINITAPVMHADGINWFIIGYDEILSSFVTFEVFKDTVIGPIFQKVENSFKGDIRMDMEISKSGNILNVSDIEKGISKLYKFDRCNGKISYLQEIKQNFSVDSACFLSQVSFSPNGKCVYIGAYFIVSTIHSFFLEYNISQSLDNKLLSDTISYIRGDPTELAPINFLGSNNKMYQYSSNGSSEIEYLTQINYPNLFEKENISYNYKSIKLPKLYSPRLYHTTPNYLLGPLTIQQLGNAYEAETIKVCQNKKVRLGELHGHEGVSYKWSPASGLSSATEAQPVFTPPGLGTYTYTLKVKADSTTCWSGESYEDKVTIIVSPDSCDKVLSKPKPILISKNNDLKINLYPNPATDEFTVDFSLLIEKSVTLEVYNLMGQQMISQCVTHKSTFSTVNWSEGVYFYKLNIGDKSIYTGKIKIIK